LSIKHKTAGAVSKDPFASVDRFVGRLPGLDHRKIEEAEIFYKQKYNKLVEMGVNPCNAEKEARKLSQDYINHLSKIHEFDVSQNYPDIGKVALKRTLAIDAKEKLRDINRIVTLHNVHYRPVYYTLKKPIAYALSERYVLMAKVDQPSIDEALHGKSKRAREVMAHLKKNYGATLEILEDAKREMAKNLKYDVKDIFIAGFQKGKFIFIPYIEKP